LISDLGTKIEPRSYLRDEKLYSHYDNEIQTEYIAGTKPLDFTKLRLDIK